jgi:hypothetical protein
MMMAVEVEARKAGGGPDTPTGKGKGFYSARIIGEHRRRS